MLWRRRCWLSSRVIQSAQTEGARVVVTHSSLRRSLPDSNPCPAGKAKGRWGRMQSRRSRSSLTVIGPCLSGLQGPNGPMATGPRQRGRLQNKAGRQSRWCWLQLRRRRGEWHAPSLTVTQSWAHHLSKELPARLSRALTALWPFCSGGGSRAYRDYSFHVMQRGGTWADRAPGDRPSRPAYSPEPAVPVATFTLRYSAAKVAHDALAAAGLAVADLSVSFPPNYLLRNMVSAQLVRPSSTAVMLLLSVAVLKVLMLLCCRSTTSRTLSFAAGSSRPTTRPSSPSTGCRSGFGTRPG